MKYRFAFSMLSLLVGSYACSSSDAGEPDSALGGGAGDESGGAAAPSDSPGAGTAGTAGTDGSRDSTSFEGSAPEATDVGAAAPSASPDQCVSQALQHVSQACAECACNQGGRCKVSVSSCGAACWGLLGCVEVECAGNTDDVDCILAACDVSDPDSATRASTCVSACSGVCADDLVSLTLPPDAGAGPDGGASVADRCPGEPIDLSATGVFQSASGTTAGLGDDYSSFCAKDGAGAGEAVYAVTIGNASGTLTIDVDSTSSSFDPVLYVESSCGDGASTLACTDQEGVGESLAMPVTGPGTLYAIIESRAGGEGSYTADFSLQAAICGDGAVNPGEDCDFGDVEPGDGCNASCQFEIPTDASNRCPGEVAALGTSATISGFTVGYGDSYDAPCGAEPGAPDRVFAFTPQSNGTLTATLSSSFDGVLSIYESCNVPNLFGLRQCSDSPRASADETVSIEAIGGEQYFVVVDGFREGSMGTFQLDVQLM